MRNLLIGFLLGSLFAASLSVFAWESRYRSQAGIIGPNGEALVPGIDYFDYRGHRYSSDSDDHNSLNEKNPC